MKRLATLFTLGLMFAFGPVVLSGCDEKIAHEKHVDVEDDEVKTTETTVRETPEGKIEVEKKKSTTEYENGKAVESETEVETKTYDPNSEKICK